MVVTTDIINNFMKKKEQFISQLIENRVMSSDKQVKLYQEAVENLFNEEEEINLVDVLIMRFLDETQNHEVMYSTLHAVEYFSKKDGLRSYVLKIIPLIKLMETEAYEWSETLFSRLVNNGEALNILIKELHNLKQIDKEYLIKLMKNLSERNPNRFEEKANLVLSRIPK